MDLKATLKKKHVLIALFLLLMFIPVPHQIHPFYIEDLGTLGLEWVSVGKLMLTHFFSLVFNTLSFSFAPEILELALWGLFAPLLFALIFIPPLRKPRRWKHLFGRAWNKKLSILLFISILVVSSVVVEFSLATTYPQAQQNTTLGLSILNQNKRDCTQYFTVKDKRLHLGETGEVELMARDVTLINPIAISLGDGKEISLLGDDPRLLAAGIGTLPNCRIVKMSENPPGLATFHMNNHAFRMDNNITLEKPTGVKRVLVVGDSFAFGAGLDQDQTLSHYLGESLGESFSEKVEVLNGGISGISTLQSLLLYQRVYKEYQPDAVVLVHSFNDVRGNLEIKHYEKPLYDFETKNVRADMFVPFKEKKNSIGKRQGPFVYSSHFLALIDKNKDVLLNRRRVMEEKPIEMDIYQMVRKELLPQAQEAYTFNCDAVLRIFQQSTDVPFLVLYVPSKAELHAPSFQRTMKSYIGADPDDFDLELMRTKLQSCSEKHGIDFIDLHNHFTPQTLEWYNQAGNHWSPKATKESAKIVHQWMKNKKVVG